MTVRIETDALGQETIVTDSADNAGLNSKITKQGLPTDQVYMRLSDGQVFTAVIGSLGPDGPTRLSPAEVDMVQHYLREKGAPEPDVFAGDPSTPTG